VIDDFDGWRRVLYGDHATAQEGDVKGAATERLAQTQFLGMVQIAAFPCEHGVGLHFDGNTNIPCNALDHVAHIRYYKDLVVFHTRGNRKLEGATFIGPCLFVAHHKTVVRDGDDAAMEYLFQLNMDDDSDALRFCKMAEKRMVGRGGVEDVDSRTGRKALLTRTKRGTLKQVLKNGVDAGPFRRKKHASSRLFRVVLPPFLWVRQGFVGFRHLFELFGIAAPVGVVTQRQRPVRLFDFDVAG